MNKTCSFNRPEFRFLKGQYTQMQNKPLETKGEPCETKTADATTGINKQTENANAMDLGTFLTLTGIAKREPN